jgi:hypothetical protein
LRNLLNAPARWEAEEARCGQRRRRPPPVVVCEKELIEIGTVERGRRLDASSLEAGGFQHGVRIGRRFRIAPLAQHEPLLSSRGWIADGSRLLLHLCFAQRRDPHYTLMTYFYLEQKARRPP